jgi:hypothetical protein
LIADALADPTTANRNPTQTTPNYLLPGKDVDGNPRTLIVVALGDRIALVDPDGHTTILPAEAAHDLATTIDDSLYHKVHGGDMTIGQIDLTIDTNLYATANAALSIDVRPHAETAHMRLELLHGRITWPVDQHTLTTIATTCTNAAHILRGELPPNQPHTHNTDPQTDTTPSTNEHTASQVEQTWLNPT